VPEGYNVSQTLLNDLKKRGFEVCVHGLVHDGKLFSSRQIFDQRAEKINAYLKDWGAGGFTSPSMHHNLDWMHALNITHSTSTFDTDPFEPQPDAVGTIFPLWVQNHPATVNPQENVQCCSQTNPSFHNANGGSQSDAEFQQTNNDSTLRPSGDVQFNNPKTLRPSENVQFNNSKTLRPSGNVQFCSRSKNESILTGDIQKVFRGLKCDSDPGEIGSAFHRASEDIGKKGTFPEGRRGYVELPYTLPQDFTLFVLMKEQTIDIWKRKLDWIAENGGMALFNAHPDYMNFNRQKNGNENYSAERYIEFLEYIKERYKDQYWHARPKDVARFWKKTTVDSPQRHRGHREKL
jgi:hypothetical protein